jgi:hypothetical protein
MKKYKKKSLLEMSFESSRDMINEDEDIFLNEHDENVAEAL